MECYTISAVDKSPKTIKEALLNISRALKLAEQVPEARSIKETILHMVYTNGRIMIAYCKVSIMYVPQAVDTCCELYQMQQELGTMLTILQQVQAMTSICLNSSRELIYKMKKYVVLMIWIWEKQNFCRIVGGKEI